MLELIKHNKIKNTGIIYQILVKRMIQQAIQDKFGCAYKLFNNYFNKGKQLGKQLSIYNILTTKTYKDQKYAKSLLQQSLNQRMKLDDIKLQKQKYFLIKQLKKYYDIKQLFSSKIQNYKLYASIYKVFQSIKKYTYNPVNISESKQELLQYVMRPINQQIIDQDIELFKIQSKEDKQKILQVFVNKYNQKFDELNKKQKQLIRLYSYEFSSNVNVDNFINEQLDKFKQINEKQENQQIKSLVQNVEHIKSIKNIQDKMYALLNIYQLEKNINE